jgi:hypothetical protein
VTTPKKPNAETGSASSNERSRKAEPGRNDSTGKLPMPLGASGSPLDSYVGRINVGTNKTLTETAPEVSQGAWRERAFAPRGVMSKEDIVSNLQAALKAITLSSNHPRVAFDALKDSWRPFLRQAMEQIGGDGMDTWLQVILTNSSRRAFDLFFQDLSESMLGLRQAIDIANFEVLALKVIELVRSQLELPKPKRLSFKNMERHLEGKLEVDELMVIRFSSLEDLDRRFQEIGATLEQLRDQIKTSPGKQPDGLYSNFTRLKYELTVLDAELKFRRKQGLVRNEGSSSVDSKD